MTALDSIRLAFNFNDNGVAALAELRDAPLTRSTDAAGNRVGNHALWIAGHLAVVEGRLHKILHGTPNPLEHWKPLFDWGSAPTDDASFYPPFDEVLGAFKRLRGATTAFIETLDDAALERPTAVKIPGLAVLDKVGTALSTIASHTAFHLGEAAVVRRVAGLPVKFVPSAELRAL